MVVLYSSLRDEIQLANQLLHWFSFIILVLLLLGYTICDKRSSVLSVTLPLLTLAWAASVFRFDVFIHRTGSYLKTIEAQLPGMVGIEGWEHWKAAHPNGSYLIGFTDLIVFAVIMALTGMILKGPCREYFVVKGWGNYLVYAAAIILLTLLLLGGIAVVPLIVGG